MMYNINYYTDLGTHWMTVHHPHFQSIYNNQTKIKFNFVKSEERNSKFDEYILNYKKTAKEIGCTDSDIDFFIKCIHPNCEKQPDGFGFSPTHGYFGPNKHLINLEHYSSLFTYLYINSNKDTSEVDLYNHPWSRLMAAAFLQPNFIGILSHMKDTINTFKIITEDYPEIHNKFIYFPLASPEVSENKKSKVYSNRLNVLFSNSYGGQMGNFPLRGGNESFQTIINLLDNYSNLYFITIGPTPQLNHPRVTQYGHLNDEQFNSIINETHVFLIPAMRIHSISLVKALCNGIVPICSDGWGFNEYITHQENGLIAKGQWGFTTYSKNNILIEDYRKSASTELTKNITDQLVYLLENPEIYNKISKNCLDYAKENFNIDKRNKILEDLLEKNYAD